MSSSENCGRVYIYPDNPTSDFAETSSSSFQDLIDESIYESDEFRMFGFKIMPCPTLRSHDWTSCPFAHRGEKAQRRDPRKYKYAAVPCPNYKRNDVCRKGDACEFAHGVFEYWLHPAKYRTRQCHAGRFCDRKVCFFAHTASELRQEIRYKWYFVNHSSRPYYLLGYESINGQAIVPFAPIYVPLRAVPASPPATAASSSASHAEGRVGAESAELLSSLARLNITDGEYRLPKTLEGSSSSDPDLPDLNWVAELVDESTKQ
ncbi:hypothetical protein RJ640_026174 [Escallonia rubra]|uniref:C3H1-type domain-containing protein n=1 Tax=Escallonia rubra TaxID=112253 RepID=A0AA88UQT2_9ASTE|nr:hypothetical protein RJ640_026174 [Escallonia rubra]